MAFLRRSQRRQQLPSSGVDAKDNVDAGIRFSVTFLGSMLVPTPTGHGSSRAATAVDKVYLEKYKVFGYGSKKVGLEVSVDEVKISGKDGGSEALVAYQMSAVTYFNLDLKHDKAFVFIVGDEKSKNYRAYVFHCDTCTRAREIAVKFKEAFKMKEIKSEEMRLRSLSLPGSTQGRNPSSYDTGEKGADEWGGFQRQGETGWRPRSKTEHANNEEKTWMETRKAEGNILDLTPSETPGVVHAGGSEDADDEFTLLAEKRLRSFDDKALPGTFENKLLLEEPRSQPQQRETFFHFGTSSSNDGHHNNSNSATSFENRNLLDL